jgi:hypothetical protein
MSLMGVLSLCPNPVAALRRFLLAWLRFGGGLAMLPLAEKPLTKRLHSTSACFSSDPFWEFSVFHLHVVGSVDQRGGSRRGRHPCGCRPDELAVPAWCSPACGWLLAFAVVGWLGFALKNKLGNQCMEPGADLNLKQAWLGHFTAD